MKEILVLNPKKCQKLFNINQKALQIPKLNDKNIATLHSNLAKAYYELFLSFSNEIYLQESSFQAKTCVFLDPGFLKAYYRLALIYEHNHKLEKSLNFCNKGLAILPSSEDLINIKARVKNKLYDAKRHATLFSDSFPKTYEEHNEDLRKEYEEKAVNISIDELEKHRKNMEENDPTLIDVFNGHEYRDGSARYSQNFETAAMYYSKAAQKGNV
jgi:tetratricopeptide (TPR) repeat protein